jgi:hypothetical protein
MEVYRKENKAQKAK